jgi:hypothetical protein
MHRDGPAPWIPDINRHAVPPAASPALRLALSTSPNRLHQLCLRHSLSLLNFFVSACIFLNTHSFRGSPPVAQCPYPTLVLRFRIFQLHHLSSSLLCSPLDIDTSDNQETKSDLVSATPTSFSAKKHRGKEVRGSILMFTAIDCA